jgi:hypothetical protein
MQQSRPGCYEGKKHMSNDDNGVMTGDLNLPGNDALGRAIHARLPDVSILPETPTTKDNAFPSMTAPGTETPLPFCVSVRLAHGRFSCSLKH